MRIPNKPKIAPDAPTDGASPPKTKLAVDPAAAHVRYKTTNRIEPYQRSTIEPARYRAYMLKSRWSGFKGSCSRVTVQSRQYSPAATAALSSWRSSYIPRPSIAYAAVTE